MPPLQISPPEAAKRLGVSPNTVRRHLESGLLPGTRKRGPGRHAWVDVTAVDLIVKTREERTHMSSWLMSQPEWIWSEPLGPALFVLDHPALRDIVRDHVHVDRKRVDWRRIYDGCRADADAALVDVARALFDGSCDVTLAWLLATLNDERLERALLGVRLRRELVTRNEALRAMVRRRRG